jgi:hypothetical protein
MLAVVPSRWLGLRAIRSMWLNAPERPGRGGKPSSKCPAVSGAVPPVSPNLSAHDLVSPDGSPCSRSGRRPTSRRGLLRRPGKSCGTCLTAESCLGVAQWDRRHLVPELQRKREFRDGPGAADHLLNKFLRLVRDASRPVHLRPAPPVHGCGQDRSNLVAERRITLQQTVVLAWACLLFTGALGWEPATMVCSRSAPIRESISWPAAAPAEDAAPVAKSLTSETLPQFAAYDCST